MSDPTGGGAGPIIIRRAAAHPSVTPQDRAFLTQVAMDLELGRKVQWLDRWFVVRLLKRVLFG